MKPLILIDERAIDSIKQMALILFHEYKKFDRDEVMYEALSKYIEAKGGTPGFTVRKKDDRR